MGFYWYHSLHLWWAERHLRMNNILKNKADGQHQVRPVIKKKNRIRVGTEKSCGQLKTGIKTWWCFSDDHLCPVSRFPVKGSLCYDSFFSLFSMIKTNRRLWTGLLIKVRCGNKSHMNYKTCRLWHVHQHVVGALGCIITWAICLHELGTCVQNVINSPAKLPLHQGH